MCLSHSNWKDKGDGLVEEEVVVEVKDVVAEDEIGALVKAGDKEAPVVEVVLIVDKAELVVAVDAVVARVHDLVKLDLLTQKLLKQAFPNLQVVELQPSEGVSVDRDQDHHLEIESCHHLQDSELMESLEQPMEKVNGQTKDPSFSKFKAGTILMASTQTEDNRGVAATMAVDVVVDGVVVQTKEEEATLESHLFNG